MDTAGPISRTVEDAAITLGAIAGHDPKDPYTWKAPVPDYRGALNRDVSGMRLALITDMLASELVHPEVRGAVVQAASKLEEMGSSVEEVSIPLSPHATIVADAFRVEPGVNRVLQLAEDANQYGHEVRMTLLAGAIMPAQAYYKAQRLREMLRQQYMEVLERYDAVVLPTYGTAPQPIEDDRRFFSKEEAGKSPYPLRRMFNVANAPRCPYPADSIPGTCPLGFRLGGDLAAKKLSSGWRMPMSKRPRGIDEGRQRREDSPGHPPQRH